METFFKIATGIGIVNGGIFFGLLMYLNRVNNHLREIAEKLGRMDDNLESLNLLEAIESYVFDMAL